MFQKPWSLRRPPLLILASAVIVTVAASAGVAIAATAPTETRQAAHQQTARDETAPGTAGQDAAGRDAAGRDVAGRDVAGRDAAADVAIRDVDRTAVAGGVIANLFEWNWPRSPASARDFLGPRGYGYVQVSPPQEHVRGQQWWVAYQPVSYRIESRKGTRVAVPGHGQHLPRRRCQGDRRRGRQPHGRRRQAGPGLGRVDVPATTTIRASTRRRTSTTVAVTATTTSATTATGTRCRTANWSTWPTSTPARSTCGIGSPAYLNDLLSLGVDGFRLDASKHMPAADIAAIKAKLSRPAYIVQEVIFGAGEPITPAEYIGNGDVHEFRYGKDLARVFRHERLAYLRNFGTPWGYLPCDRAAVCSSTTTIPSALAVRAVLPGQRQLRAGQRVHARLAVRVADGDVELRVRQSGPGPAVGASGRTDNHLFRRWLAM